jgi:hypothetical protein
MKHVEELRAHGIAAPEKIPAFYAVPKHLVAVVREFEVLGNRTSGEVEPVLFFKDGDIYVGLGSDHTDRDLERATIDKAKLVCPKVVARELWSFQAIKSKWGRLLLRSWLGDGHRKQLYQEARLNTFIAPEKLIALARLHVRGGNLEGMVLFLGTIPMKNSGFRFGATFTGELLDEASQNKLSFNYRIKPMRWLK